MTREDLLELICPTDSTNDCCSGEADYCCNECNVTLLTWLNEYEKTIRNELIKDIVYRLVVYHGYSQQNAIITEIKRLREDK